MNVVSKIRNVKGNFRNNFTFAIRNIKSIHYDTEINRHIKKKLPLQVILKCSEWLSGIKCNNSVTLN